MPRSLISLSMSRPPSRSGMLPMPSCRVSPLRKYGKMLSAILISTSLGVAFGSGGNGSCSPSTIMPTSVMWMVSSKPPLIHGRCSLISRMTTSASRRISPATPVVTDRLKKPCLSMGGTLIMATLRSKKCL